MALTAVEELTQPSEQAEEAAEPPVEAMPKIGRAAFLYMEPRPGLDGLQYFRQCASCESFVPEASMGGAIQGARCAKFGSQFPVTDDDSCSLYYPWHSGLPCAEMIATNAMELRKGIPGGPLPYSMGYKSQCAAKCRSCRFVDFRDEMNMGVAKTAECEAYESLNECSPNIFELITTINPNGGCSLWQKEQPDYPDVGGMR